MHSARAQNIAFTMKVIKREKWKKRWCKLPGILERSDLVSVEWYKIAFLEPVIGTVGRSPGHQHQNQQQNPLHLPKI